MSKVGTEVLKAAIETKRREIAELEALVRKLEAESSADSGKFRRRRRSKGFKQGSVPFHVHAILTEVDAPMAAADLSEALKMRGKKADSRTIASSLNRYIGKVFNRTDDGMYALIKD